MRCGAVTFNTTNSEKQDGGGRHIEFRKNAIVFDRLNRFSSYSTGERIRRVLIYDSIENCVATKSKMAVAAILKINEVL